MPELKVQKTKAFRSLTVTLAIAFLALTVAIVLIVNSLDIYSSFRSQREAIAGQLQFVAQNAANTVRSFIQEKFSMLSVIARTGPIIDVDEQKRAVERLIAEPAFRQLVLVDAREQELIKVSRISRFELGCLTGQIRSDLFSQVGQGGTYISSVCIDKITSEPMVVMAVPVTDVFGNFKGALMAEVSLKFTWDLVYRIKVGERGLAYVVDKQGNLIAFGDVSRVLRGENLKHLEEVNEFVQGIIGREAIMSKGIEDTYVATAHVPLGMPDWAVVIELPILEAYRTVIQGLGISLSVMLLSLVLAIVLGIYLSKRITKSIISLRDVAIEIGKGDLTKRAEIVSRDEIGQLAAAFNEMTDKLQAFYERLEEKVKERTKELEEAKVSLEIKVEARTKELEELTESLDEQIKERTKELRGKVEELERFHRLAVGRELKMIELKKEIDRLEKELEKYEKSKK